jgi:hypothetical protein
LPGRARVRPWTRSRRLVAGQECRARR